jgi:hypothetical protein
MSLQAGIWNLDGMPVSQLFIEGLKAETDQSGLEDFRVHIAGSLGMVYRAYHTTQESYRELQPLKSKQGKVLTWDGRLDNRDDLIRDLSPYLGSDRTDPAIAMSVFEAWVLTPAKE